MIDLNEHAQKAQEIAFNRWKKKGVDYHTPAILKHCAGEVCEAVEAYDQYLYEYIESRRNKLAAESALKIAGFQPVNPAEEHLPDGATWADYMRQDIKLLCDCDAIYMLNGWRESAGAKIEHKLARDIGIEIIYEIKKPVYNAEYRRAQYEETRGNKQKSPHTLSGKMRDKSN